MVVSSGTPMRAKMLVASFDPSLQAHPVDLTLKKCACRHEEQRLPR